MKIQTVSFGILSSNFLLGSINLQETEFLRIYGKIDCNKELLNRWGIKDKRWRYKRDLLKVRFSRMMDESSLFISS